MARILNQIEWNGRLFWAPKTVAGRTDAKIIQDQGFTNPITGKWVKMPEMLRIEARGKAGQDLADMKKGQQVLVKGQLRFYKTGKPFIKVFEIEDATVKPLLQE